MLLNEHDSKRLFHAANIPVPPGALLRSKDLDDFAPGFALPWFLKAQVLTGGRGKAGGIRRVSTMDEFTGVATTMLDMDIKGHAVPFLRVEPSTDIARECYLSFTVSRDRRSIVFTTGREGGIHIEETSGDNLLVQDVHLPDGLQPHQMRAACVHLDLSKEQRKPFFDLVGSIWNCVLDSSLLLAEINPLVLTTDGAFLALDGKVEIDDNACDLDDTLAAFYRAEHHAQEETIARTAGLSFVKLKGYVGLMVNGAGLAMATMDLLNYSDLPAANFLDLGGGADRKRMKYAFSLLFEDDQVHMIFINLFGGILSCKQVALAMKAALGDKPPRKPIVARLSGFEAEEGLDILRGLQAPGLHLATTMAEASAVLALRPDNAPQSAFTAPEPAAPGKLATSSAGPFLAAAPPFNIDANTPVLVQGITGQEGRLHTGLMQSYGANIVAGVTPFKGGQEVLGVPVYSSVAQACAHHQIKASIIFVPPAMAADAVREAAANGIQWVVCITEGIRQHEMLAALREIEPTQTRVIGPNTPGLIIPGQTKIGILPGAPFTPGNVAVLSRSGTLTYEVAARLSGQGIGQSVSLGVGGDPFIGTTFTDMFAMLHGHDQTRAVVVLGEIGGNAEEDLARWVADTGFAKPVVSFIAGRTAPPGRRLGHAGAILEQGGGIERKIAAMQAGGFTVCPDLDSIAPAVKAALG